MLEKYIDWRIFAMRFMCILLLASSVAGGCSAINRKLGLKDDNAIEEAIEHQIKEQTGIDLDLTPSSPEAV